MKKLPAVVTKLDPIEPLLTLTEVAEIYRISPATIRRGLQNGTFSPQPFETYPYRWRPVDVARDLERPRDVHVRRNHGFAARITPAKATLPDKPAKRRATR